MCAYDNDPLGIPRFGPFAKCFISAEDHIGPNSTVRCVLRPANMHSRTRENFTHGATQFASRTHQGLVSCPVAGRYAVGAGT